MNVMEVIIQYPVGVGKSDYKNIYQVKEEANA